MGLAYFISSVSIITAVGLLLLCWLAVMPAIPIVFLNLCGFHLPLNINTYLGSTILILIVRGAFYKYRMWNRKSNLPLHW